MKRTGGDGGESERGGGVDGSIEEKKKKGKISLPPFILPLATPMWNGAIPTSVQVVGCRRRWSVASS